MKNKITKLLLVLAVMVLPLSFANAATMSYVPRVYLAGYTGADKNLLGKADILAPLLLTENNNLFAYAQGKTAYEARALDDNTYTGSLALGFRQIVKDTTVLGAYVFGDYTTSTTGHDFEVVSPGIESLSRAWDFRANGYFPISSKRWVDEGWASSFGDYSHLRPTGNRMYDHWYQYYQEVGPGADAEVGRNLYMLKGKVKGILFKGFLNGYYFDMKHNDDVVGGGVRLTIQPSPAVKISLRDSYDNYEHNTFMMGVQLSFYDLLAAHRSDPIDVQDLQRNLFLPIERNMGTIGSGSSIPVTDTKTDKAIDSGEGEMYDNIWYFKAGVASDNAVEGTGTYEDPFIGLTNDNVQYIRNTYPSLIPTINPFPLMYFNTGTYSLADFSVANEAYRFELPASWSMYGWVLYNGIEKPTIHPAVGNDRPLFIGGFQLNSNTSINDLRLENISVMDVSPLDVGVELSNAANVAMNDVTVGVNVDPTPVDNSITTGTYKTGISVNNSGLTINNSQIYAYGIDTTESSVVGILATGGGLITIGNNNTVSVLSVGEGIVSAIGILNNGGLTTTISGSGNTISATAKEGVSANVEAAVVGFGIYITNGSILNIESSAIETNIYVGGSTVATGIICDSSSFLWLGKDSPIDNADAYDDLVTYNNTEVGSQGYALDWQGTSYQKAW